MWNMFKVNNKDTRTTPPYHIEASPLVSIWYGGNILVYLFLILNIFTPSSTASIANFEQVNTSWVGINPSRPVNLRKLY